MAPALPSASMRKESGSVTVADGKKPALSSLVCSSPSSFSPRHWPRQRAKRRRKDQNGVSGDKDATTREDVDVGDTTGYKGGKRNPPPEGSWSGKGSVECTRCLGSFNLLIL